MAEDETIPGGHDSLVDSDPPRGRGVYASHPASTPRFHTGNDISSIENQARFFLQFPDRQTFARYRANIPERARKLVEVLSPESAVGGTGYFDFILDSVSEQFQEKFQVSEVLSDGHVAYFFGQKAPMWTLSGTLLNTRQDPWYDAFHILYQDVLRGSQLAKHRLPLRLRYDNREILGSLVGFNANFGAENEQAVQFQTQFLVSKVYVYRYDNIYPTVVDDSEEGLEDRFDQAEATYTEMFADLEEAQRLNRENEERAETIRNISNAVDITNRIQNLGNLRPYRYVRSGVTAGVNTGGPSEEDEATMNQVRFGEASGAAFPGDQAPSPSRSGDAGDFRFESQNNIDDVEVD